MMALIIVMNMMIKIVIFVMIILVIMIIIMIVKVMAGEEAEMIVLWGVSDLRKVGLSTNKH